MVSKLIILNAPLAISNYLPAHLQHPFDMDHDLAFFLTLATSSFYCAVSLQINIEILNLYDSIYMLE